MGWSSGPILILPLIGQIGTGILRKNGGEASVAVSLVARLANATAASHPSANTNMRLGVLSPSSTTIINIIP